MGSYFATLKVHDMAIEETRARALTTIRQARATQAPEDLKRDTDEVRRILDECFDHALGHLDDTDMVIKMMVPAKELIEHFLEEGVEDYSSAAYLSLAKLLYMQW